MLKNSNNSIKRNEIHSLSFLRGAAALYVVIAHIMIWGGYKSYFPNPKVAVDVFIFISGFLIFGGMLSKKHTISSYFKHRFFRIAPSYYFIILVFALLYPYIRDGLLHIQSLDRIKWPLGGKYDASFVTYDLKNILLHVTFIFGLLPKYSQSSYMGDWSIGLEMQFYLLAPLLFIFYSRRWLIIVLVALAISACIFSKHNAFTLSFTEPSFILIKLHIFILGAVISLAVREKGLYLFYLLILSTILLYLQYWVQKGTYISNNSAVYLTLSVILVLCYKYIDHFFDNFVVHFFSQISYPLYLVHGIFIGLSGLVYMYINSTIPLLYVIAIVTLPLSIFFAWIISITIERKGIEIAKRGKVIKELN